MTTPNGIDFASRHALWKQAMKGVGEGDPNAIVSQLTELTWRIACFRMIQETRVLAADREKGEPRLSPLLHELLDSSFADAVLISMRRIVGSFDNPELLDHPTKGTYSLAALLKDIRTHRESVTRSALVGLDGIACDLECVCRAEDEYLRSHADEWVPIPPEISSRRAKQRHREIDVLCGVTPDKRSADDHLSESWIEEMVAHLKCEVGKHTVWANKFVAHLATPDSRESAATQHITLLWKDIWNAHRAICQVVARLDVFLVSGIHKAFLPIPYAGAFMHLDQPLAHADDIPKLRKFWNELEQDISKYSEARLDVPLRGNANPSQ